MGLIRNIGRTVKRVATSVVRTVSNVVSNVPVVGGAVSSGINRIFGTGTNTTTSTSPTTPTSIEFPPRTVTPAASDAGPVIIGVDGFKGGINRNTFRTPQPVPDPDPKLPTEAIPGDPRLIPGEKGIDQNPERYREFGDRWEIQAEPQITPLELVKGMRPELKPVLLADGVIVKIGDEYLCSKRTLADILNSGNPHYDIAENGRVLNRPIGRSVPIISIDTTKLKEMGDGRDRVNRYAGVKSVDYLNESEPVPGTSISQGILNQINWTLVGDIERWPDRYEVWDILSTLRGDYSVAAIKTLNTKTEQDEDLLGRTVIERLNEFMTGIGNRLSTLREDFNSIKATFYNGDPPPGTVPTLKYYRIARTIDPDEEERKNSAVFKTTRTTSVGESPVDTVIRELNDIRNPKTALAALNPALTGVSTQRNALIAKWQGYKWTATEAEYLKAESVRSVENPPTRPYFRGRAADGRMVLRWDGYELDGRVVGISTIRWTPTMTAKAGLIVPLPAVWNSPSPGFPQLAPAARIPSAIVPELIRLFGEPDTGYKSLTDNRRESWWIEANAKRQAEIVKLAYDIRKIELETGKPIPPIQPAGVNISGTSTIKLGR